MICFDLYLNGEKLCRAGKDDLSVLSGFVVFREPKPQDEETQFPPIYTSLSGLRRSDSNESAHPHWIEELELSVGDELTFRIVDSDTADEPVSESITDSDWEEEQQRKYYEMLKAKYENSIDDLVE